MNILQVISSGGFFGAENVVLQLASELRKKDFCMPVVGVFENLKAPHLEVSEVCLKNGIQTHMFTCRGRVDIKTIVQLRRFIQDHNIEIIHTHGYKSNLYSYFASIGLQTRRVATCHNWLGDDFKMRFYAILDRFFLRQFDRVVAVSEEVMEKINDSGISSDKVSMVKNGIYIDRFSHSNSVNKIKDDLRIDSKSNVIGTVGRISMEKGHRTLLNIASKIIEHFQGTVFLVVGDGPLRNDLQREFSSSSINFTGIRDDVDKLYQCMDIFVLPSLTEGLPMVLLEAMASKLPVVATRVGDVPKVITDGDTGILVEPGDKEGLKEALLYLLSNKDIAIEMGQKGYEKVKEHYSSEKMTDEYLKIYQDVLKNNRRLRKKNDLP